MFSSLTWPHEASIRHRRGVGVLCGVALSAGVVWLGCVVLGPVQRDLHAARSLKPHLAEGSRLVPVRTHPHLRGDAKRDFHCFDDGLCLYAMPSFRRLYPAYNDLEDDVLLVVIQDQRGAP